MRDVYDLPDKEKKNIRSKFLKSEFLVHNLSLIISKFRGGNEDSDELMNEIIPNIFYSYEDIRQLYEALTEDDNRFSYDKLKSNFVDHVFFYLCKYYINDIDDGDNNFAVMKESFYKDMGIFYDDLYNNFIIDKYRIKKSSFRDYYKIEKVSDEDAICYIHNDGIPGIVKDLLEINFDKSPVTEYNFTGRKFVFCKATDFDSERKKIKLRITRYFVGDLLKLISNNYLKVSTDESDQDKYELAECEVQELDKENKNGRIYSSESVEVDDDGFSII